MGLDMLITQNTLVVLDNMSNVCYILSLALRLGVAAFANRLYKDTVFRRVKKLRAENQDSPDYSTILTAKGGVSKVAVIIYVVVMLVLSFTMSFTMISAISQLY